MMLRADIPDKRDPAHLRDWRMEYDRIRRRYVINQIDRNDAMSGLRRLGFCYQALDIELTEFARLRAKWASRQVDVGPLGA
jgi:hypothetical protein